MRKYLLIEVLQLIKVKDLENYHFAILNELTGTRQSYSMADSITKQTPDIIYFLIVYIMTYEVVSQKKKIKPNSNQASSNYQFVGNKRNTAKC